jgi:YfiH family protein
MRQPYSNGSVPYLQFHTLPPLTGLSHAIFTRQGGVSPIPFTSLNMSESVRDSANNVAANRARAYSVLGRSVATVVQAHLVHGAAVMVVGREHHGTIPGRFDGMITNEPGCGLAMNFADCAPILLVDPINKAIGLGHAGWQGAIVDLPGAMVRAMQSTFGSDPATLWAGIGPSIGPCCYEVGEPVTSAVESAFDRPEELLIPQEYGPRPHFDLPEANRRNLQQAGVRTIETAPFCTACRTDLFFSHRAEKGRTGRFGVLMVLESDTDTDSLHK